MTGMVKVIIFAFILLAPAARALAQHDFSSALESIRQETVAAQDNTRVARPAPQPIVERVNQPGSSEYLFKLYGQDFNKHAEWHMGLLSLYRRGQGGRRPPREDALASIRALSLLGGGAEPLASGDALYWLQKELIAALKYAPAEDARGSAALALGVVAAGKGAAAADALSALGSTILYDGEAFEVRRFAVMALAGVGSPEAAAKLKDCGRALAATHDFIGRGKFRYEEDESAWSLEAAIVGALESMLRGEGGAQALAALKYFADLTNRTCGDYTVIKLPDDRGIDETLLVNARLALAGRGGQGVYLASNRDNPESGSAKCLLPIVNGGDLCELRVTASRLFRDLHGAVISAQGSYVQGRADCTELITNKVMLEFATIYLTGLGTEALVKGAISASVRGLRVVAGIKRAAKVERYKKFMEMAFGYYERADRIKEYTEYMEALKKATR